MNKEEIIEAFRQIGSTKGKYKVESNDKIVYKESLSSLYILILLFLISPTLINLFLVPKMTLATAQDIAQLKFYLNLSYFLIPLLLLTKLFSITYIEINFSTKNMINRSWVKKKQLLFNQVEKYHLEEFRRKGLVVRSAFLEGNSSKLIVANSTGYFNKEEMENFVQNLFNLIKSS